MLAVLLAWVSGCAAVSPQPLASPPAQAGGAGEDWGVEVRGVRCSAAGYMLDFRYRVLDPDRALPLFARGLRPYLVDEATGARYLVPSPPKTGPLRSTNRPLAGRTYAVIFANPGRAVAPGALVTVVIGEFRAEHLRVE